MLEFLQNIHYFFVGTAASLTIGVSTILPLPANHIGTQNNPIKGEIITRTGEYTYSGQTLEYKVNIPLNGGKITGEFSGVCHGPITGTYKGAPSYAIDNGEAKATCPILLYKKLSATYIAHLDLKNGQASIDWMGDIPYTSGKGSFTANFTPVN